MSRAAAGIALVLVLACAAALVLGVRAAGANLGAFDLAVAGVILLAAFGTFRRRRSAQILMSTGALVLLGRCLPAYFQTSQMWPFLAVIILSSATFGFGVLGILLDMYRPRNQV